MPVTYLIQFDVKPAEEERFLSLLNGVLDSMREEPTFHEAVLHRHPETANRFMLYETWEDHGDVLEAQLSRPYRRAWHDALPEILARERDISVWEPLRTDRRP
ncbi:MAG: putative quinol monooxygenase [Shinella sp.]|nr:putative quinol monooxygenase [Shinella sp.]